MLAAWLSSKGAGDGRMLLIAGTLPIDRHRQARYYWTIIHYLTAIHASSLAVLRITFLITQQTADAPQHSDQALHQR